MRDVRLLLLADDLTVASSKENFNWECQNGGQLWPGPEVAGYDNSSTLPNVVCVPGWDRLFIIIIIGLLADLGFQVRNSSPPEQPVC